MTTLVKSDRLSLPDLLWSAWPFGGVGVEFPNREAIAMRVEEFVDGETLVVRAEVPGVDPEKDVDITVSDGRLIVTAERREARHHGEVGKPGYRSEFRYGSYRRTLSLPEHVSPEEIKATYDHGILEVRVPLGAEPPAAHKIPVTTV